MMTTYKTVDGCTETWATERALRGALARLQADLAQQVEDQAWAALGRPCPTCGGRARWMHRMVQLGRLREWWVVHCDRWHAWESAVVTVRCERSDL